MFTSLYPILFKTSYLAVVIPTILVIVSAVLSARSMGGTLGGGLKKIAAGTIVHTTLIMTYILLERGDRGFLDDNQVRMFFMVGGLFASVLLILGYLQVYKIAKKLRLFTP